MKRIVVDKKVCAGCLTCAMMCSSNKYGVTSLQMSSVKITGDESTASFTPQLCICCTARSCVLACPTEALMLDEDTGIVLVDMERCISCEACISACEYSGISMIKNLDGKICINVCDQCGGKPQCVKYCRQGALQYVTV